MPMYDPRDPECCLGSGAMRCPELRHSPEYYYCYKYPCPPLWLNLDRGLIYRHRQCLKDWTPNHDRT